MASLGFFSRSKPGGCPAPTWPPPPAFSAFLAWRPAASSTSCRASNRPKRTQTCPRVQLAALETLRRRGVARSFFAFQTWRLPGSDVAAACGDFCVLSLAAGCFVHVVLLEHAHAPTRRLVSFSRRRSSGLQIIIVIVILTA